MSIKSDRWIRQMALEHGMIEPFEENQVREGVISYGLSSYGYDIRVTDEFKIFTNALSAVVDPKHFQRESFIDFKGDVCIIPPNSFVLARTVEYFRIPRNVLTICVGKCLTGDTRVVDAETGDYLPLSEFVARQSKMTLALNEWRLRPQTVTHHIPTGIKPVYELKTRTGLKIKVTATHPFRTWNGWTPLQELTVGQRIAVARSCPVFGHEEWSEHEAVLLGLLLSDGQCHTPGHSPRYTTDDPWLVEVCQNAAHAFGVHVSHVGRYGYNLVNQKGRGGFVTKNRVYDWLEKLGCNVRSADKFIPEIVFRAQKTRVAQFLQALFSGDGSVYLGKEGGRFLEYSTISERLAYDVRHLLLRFGIFALVKSKQLSTGGLAYRVQITDANMIALFAQEIGFIAGSRKQARLDEVMADIYQFPAQKSNFDTLPAEAWGLMKETVHRAGQTLSSVGLRRTQPNQSLPYLIAQQVVPAVVQSEFSSIVEGDVVWDTVTSITFMGEEEVYDLTVPTGHNFLANDMIVHNSTYARCGLIVNVTPFEPEWEGYVTLEISNTTPLPAKVYAFEGISQVLFFESDEPCETSYADRKGKYQSQQGIVLPKI